MLTTTYHVKHRYGFVGDYHDIDKIVIDCRDAVIYSRIGSIRVAEEINRKIGEFDRRAQVVMLTQAGTVRLVHGAGGTQRDQTRRRVNR